MLFWQIVCMRLSVMELSELDFNRGRRNSAGTSNLHLKIRWGFIIIYHSCLCVCEVLAEREGNIERYWIHTQQIRYNLSLIIVLQRNGLYLIKIECEYGMHAVICSAAMNIL